jgi:hypothetical protein
MKHKIHLETLMLTESLLAPILLVFFTFTLLVSAYSSSYMVALMVPFTSAIVAMSFL